MKYILPTILSLFFFSLWAGFALLIINPYLLENVPGYRIGRICIWEYVAMGISILIAFLVVRKWGNMTIENINGENKLILNPKYGVLFIVYFVIAILVAIWQFWIFAHNF